MSETDFAREFYRAVFVSGTVMDERELIRAIQLIADIVLERQQRIDQRP
jgi:hypothetical protein